LGGDTLMSWNNIIPASILLYETYIEDCKIDNIEPLTYKEWLDAKDKN
jgi:hypothetical protein